MTWRRVEPTMLFMEGSVEWTDLMCIAFAHALSARTRSKRTKLCRDQQAVQFSIYQR